MMTKDNEIPDFLTGTGMTIFDVGEGTNKGNIGKNGVADCCKEDTKEQVKHFVNELIRNIIVEESIRVIATRLNNIVCPQCRKTGFIIERFGYRYSTSPIDGVFEFILLCPSCGFHPHKHGYAKLNLDLPFERGGSL